MNEVNGAARAAGDGDLGIDGAIDEFVRHVSEFKDDVDNRLQQQEERMTMLDRKSRATMRPLLAQAAAPELPHQKAFAAYLRSGDDDALRGIAVEEKAMSTAVAADGGYLVDPQTAETVRGVLRSAASLRQIANIVTVDATSYDLLVDHTEMGSGWSNETGSPPETGTPVIDRITIALHELSALPKASQRLLDDAAFDIESWLAGRIAERFARAEAAAFVTGDGIDKPRGFLDHPAIDEANWSWGSIGMVGTGKAGAFDGPDAIVDLVYALGAQYRAGASFVMNSKTAGAVRKLKDADGRFLWSDGLAAQEPARLLGYPVSICEDMPDIAVDATAIAFGDFAAGYTIAERPDLRILRDPFSAKPHVLFYATKRVGGDVSDFAAIKLLRFGL
ncbi:phage major capsid protein [Profundibacterium mesophilum]|uniref:Phage phi-C31 major capsid gp36-like protein n=1 Tax=Profundibacterium mesophilum KAUST100406-0324 TaxID=1037889 RepID=A0A921TE26_9RHOB|nr:phage major capsid protein [Profundibacterium mesophilum]KAF0677413.1 Phage phi-C31 major capsid gp36-like protein [Profundibacterium mesophilum KAUST100406-0324]